MDDKLKEIEQRIEVGFVTEDDILYLLGQAKRQLRCSDCQCTCDVCREVCGVTNA